MWNFNMADSPSITTSSLRSKLTDKVQYPCAGIKVIYKKTDRMPMASGLFSETRYNLKYSLKYKLK